MKPAKRKARARHGRIEYSASGTTTMVDGPHPNHEAGATCWCGPFVSEREDDFTGMTYKMLMHKTVGNA
jgi:hypothetical protein